MVNGLIGMRMDRRGLKILTRMVKIFLPNVGMKMGMSVYVVNLIRVVNNPHPKDLSKWVQNELLYSMYKES